MTIKGLIKGKVLRTVAGSNRDQQTDPPPRRARTRAPRRYGGVSPDTPSSHSPSQRSGIRPIKVSERRSAHSPMTTGDGALALCSSLSTSTHTTPRPHVIPHAQSPAPQQRFGTTGEKPGKDSCPTPETWACRVLGLPRGQKHNQADTQTQGWACDRTGTPGQVPATPSRDSCTGHRGLRGARDAPDHLGQLEEGCAKTLPWRTRNRRVKKSSLTTTENVGPNQSRQSSPTA